MVLAGKVRFVRWVAFAFAIVCAASVTMQSQEAGQPQRADLPTLRVTTQERLESEPWWPTMATAPLSRYAGSEACTSCHAEESSAHPTAMERAAERGSQARFLPNELSSQDFTYRLGPGLRYSVSRGHDKAAAELAWVVGAGDLAQTFLYSDHGRWFQSQTSYYTQLAAMDITTGFGPSTSHSMALALGNQLTPAEARACFNCHTVHATTPAGLDPMHAEAGIGCEACHGPGAQHVATRAATSGHSLALGDSDGIFQPGKLSPADSIDFCGSCHRSFADASLSTGPAAGSAVVRFQPYRLEESKCWRATQDERLTCVACHNPHQPLNRTDSSYDRNCLQCHGRPKTAVQHVTAAICPRSTRDCVTCHMPKVELPSMHGSFTDHYIRIVHVGEPLPR